jgi:hypothetical protein
MKNAVKTVIAPRRAEDRRTKTGGAASRKNKKRLDCFAARARTVFGSAAVSV